jgi:hypothetical protein
MVVERWTWEAKPGRREDLIAWCKALMEQEENKGLTSRIYGTSFGTYNKVTMEVEYETVEAWRLYWKSLEWTPKLGELMATRNAMQESGVTRELLQLY